jgi:uncharacterized protein YndB with AHSA1/START domain
MKGAEQVLTVATRIAARPATVYRWLTEPERFGRWMGAAQGKAKLDSRIGGALRVEFPPMGGSGAATVVVGEVLELVPDERFAFTWGYESEGGPVPAGSTRVEVTLEPSEDGTLLVLRHSGLPDETQRQQHRGGWRLYASVLAAGAADEELGRARAQATDDWFAAWAEPDPAKRRALLERSCDATVEFRDAYAALRGIDDLDAHIAVSQMMMQGMTLAPAGAPDGCHELVRFPWQVRANGAVVARGLNVGRLGVDGRWRTVHGFKDGTTP